jgi:enolase-phosphatase E1
MRSPDASRAWNRVDSPLAELRTPRAVVLDLEGTITPIAFVKDVLFPYARERLPAFVRSHLEESRLQTLLGEVRALAAGLGKQDVEAAIQQLLIWSDADAKIPPLKALQGMIWDEGFANGTFCSPLYPDVAPTLRAWRARGIVLYIYSSGSIDAQKLLLRHTNAGNLCHLFHGHFDATMGPKVNEASYRALRDSIGFEPSEILFLSDHPGEVRGARRAGWHAVLIERDGAVPGREPPAMPDIAGLAAV